MEQGYRPCPYCGEPIREEAKICRYCNREVQVPPPRTSTGTLNMAWKVLFAAVVLLGAAFVISVLIFKSTKPEERPSAGPGGLRAPEETVRRPPTPVVTKLLDGHAVVRAGQYISWDLRVEPGMINPKVVGKFHAFGGGGNDIQAVLAESAEFENWINGHQAKVYYSTGKTTNGQIDVALAPGNYVLALSNTFSTLSDKEVSGNIELRFSIQQ